MYADTLAIATMGYWTDRIIMDQDALAVTVVDVTAISAVVA